MSKPRQRSSAKKAARTQVDAILRNAETLLADPDILIPECRTWNVLFPWRGVRRRLAKVASNAGDAKRLEPFAKHGHPLARAFAASLMVLSEGKAPYLAAVKTPMGEFQFAMRGAVKPDYLVGVQHFDDPVARLLAYRRETSRWGGYLYSMPNGLYYSRKCDAADYMAAWKGEFPDEGACSLPGPFLTIRWLSAGKEFHVCPSHREESGSTYCELTGMILSKDASEDFKLRGGWRLRTSGGFDETPVVVDGSLRRAYTQGLMEDSVLLDKLKAKARASLEGGDGPLFMIGDQTFGGDASGFLSALSPTDDERRVLERMLAGVAKPVLIDEPRSNSAMLALRDRFADGLRALTIDEALVRQALGDSGADTPTETVRRLSAMERVRLATASLPTLTRLGPAGQFVDRVARLAKSGEVDEALRVAEKDIPAVDKGKVLACALISALDGLGPRAWLFSSLEMESGEYLRPKAEAILAAKGDAYRAAVAELLLHSGSGEEA